MNIIINYSHFFNLTCAYPGKARAAPGLAMRSNSDNDFILIIMMIMIIRMKIVIKIMIVIIMIILIKMMMMIMICSCDTRRCGYVGIFAARLGAVFKSPLYSDCI